MSEPHRRLRYELPDSVVLYEIVGPLFFFGAAARAMRALQNVDGRFEVVTAEAKVLQL